MRPSATWRNGWRMPNWRCFPRPWRAARPPPCCARRWFTVPGAIRRSPRLLAWRSAPVPSCCRPMPSVCVSRCTWTTWPTQLRGGRRRSAGIYADGGTGAGSAATAGAAVPGAAEPVRACAHCSAAPGPPTWHECRGAATHARRPGVRPGAGTSRFRLCPARVSPAAGRARYWRVRQCMRCGTSAATSTCTQSLCWQVAQ